MPVSQVEGAEVVCRLADASPAWLVAEPAPARLGALCVATAVGDVAVQMSSPADAPAVEPLPLVLDPHLTRLLRRAWGHQGEA